MNKYFLVTVLVVAAFFSFVACNDKEEIPVVSLESSEYVMAPSGSVTVRLKAQDRNLSEALTIPFTLSGTAVEGEHYTVSSEAFVFAVNSSVAEVVFLAKDNFGEQRTIQLNLGSLPVGFIAGNITETSITVQPKDDIVYTFNKRNESLFQTAQIVVKLGTASSPQYRVEENMMIPIVVESEGTTAEEGIHYEFVGEKSVLIEKGKSEGIVKLNWLKTEDDKKTIKLGVGTELPAGLYPGQNANVAVTIVGPMGETLQGRWAAKQMSNFDYLDLNTSWMDDPSVYPLPSNVSERDIIEITEDEEGTPILVTSLDPNGVLKNYFMDCTLEYKDEEIEVLQEAGIPPQRVSILLVDLKEANVNFSATKKNIRTAEIGFRTFEEGGQIILEVTLRDYEPTDFLQNIYDMVKDWGDVPAMKMYPLRYHFVQQED